MGNPMESDLIRLRALEPEDVNILYRWENDTETWKVSNTIAPFSKHVLRKFIAEQQRDIYETRQLRLIIESKADGKPVGAIDLFDLDPYNCRAGVGILIYDKNDQGQGYASHAVSLFSGVDAQSTVLQYSDPEFAEPRSVQEQGVYDQRIEKGVDPDDVRLAG